MLTQSNFKIASCALALISSLAIAQAAQVNSRILKLDLSKNPQCQGLVSSLYGKPILDPQGNVQVQLVKGNQDQLGIGVLTDLYRSFEIQLNLATKTRTGIRYMGTDFVHAIVALRVFTPGSYLLQETLSSGSTQIPVAGEVRVLGSAILRVDESGADLYVNGALTAGRASEIACKFSY